MKDIKLVVSDMDGTLLTSEKKIADETRAAIKKLKKAGIDFTICTGRIPTMAEYYIKTLEIEVPVIACNGAVIWEQDKREAKFGLAADPEEAFLLFDFCREQGLDYSALTLRTNYFSPGSIRRQRFIQYNKIAAEDGLDQIEMEFFNEDHSCVRGQEIYKILIYDRDEKRRSMAEAFIRTLKKTGYTTSEEGLLDIADIRITKGFGLEKLAKLLGLKKEEICVFGDYYNDLPMFDHAGFCVAMANGCDEMKEKADLVTRSNDEHGVAWAIEQYILNEPEEAGRITL